VCESRGLELVLAAKDWNTEEHLWAGIRELEPVLVGNKDWNTEEQWLELQQVGNRSWHTEAEDRAEECLQEAEATSSTRQK
jgi:hypothetical protein